MRYYLDTEFNGFGGDLISLALVREDGHEFYVSTACANPVPWVAENVLPIVEDEEAMPLTIPAALFPRCIARFLADDFDPVIIADWPDDIRYFCAALIVGPGQMINIPGVRFEMRRVDAYPTTLPGAVQHNALWDARALRHLLEQRVARHQGAA